MLIQQEPVCQVYSLQQKKEVDYLVADIEIRNLKLSRNFCSEVWPVICTFHFPALGVLRSCKGCVQIVGYPPLILVTKMEFNVQIIFSKRLQLCVFMLLIARKQTLQPNMPLPTTLHHLRWSYLPTLVHIPLNLSTYLPVQMSFAEFSEYNFETAEGNCKACVYQVYAYAYTLTMHGSYAQVRF